MFFILSKLLDVFLSPYTWALLFVAAAVSWRVSHRSRRELRRRRLFGAIGIAIFLVASFPPFANALLWHLEHRTTSTYDDATPYDAVILLGGIVEEQAMRSSGQIAFNENVERLIITHRLLRVDKARMVIVAGESPEAEVLARQLEDWGIAKDRIILEKRSRNTHENAAFSRVIVRERGFQRVLIVTSAFHMARARECFAAVDMNVDTLAVDYRASRKVSFDEWLPRARSLALSAMVLREMAGGIIYRKQGYAKPVP